MKKRCPSCSGGDTEVWYLLSGHVINRCFPASWERKLAAVGKEGGKAARRHGWSFPEQLMALSMGCDILESHSHDPGAGHLLHPVRPVWGEGHSPVGGRPGDPAARRGHQHGVSLLGQPHPLLHQPGFPLHVVLRLLCRTTRGHEHQDGGKDNFQI